LVCNHLLIKLLFVTKLFVLIVAAVSFHSIAAHMFQNSNVLVTSHFQWLILAEV